MTIELSKQMRRGQRESIDLEDVIVGFKWRSLGIRYILGLPCGR